MKNTGIIVLSAFIVLLAISCNTKTGENRAKELAYPKFIIHYPTDTINYTDANGHKQGLWVEVNSKNQERVIYKDDTAYTFTDSTVQDLVKKLNGK